MMRKEANTGLQRQPLPSQSIMKFNRKLFVGGTALIVCGALLNVAIAWGLAARFARASNSTRQEIPGWAIVPLSAVSEQCQSMYDNNWGRHGVGWSECYADRHYLDMTPGYPVMWTEETRTIASGWPMLTLRFVEYTSFQAPADRAGEPTGLRRGVLMPEWILKLPKANALVRSRRLPTEPLPGFAVNTIFYAAILALPLSLRPIRRQIRARRGKCVKCVYDLAGTITDACPECGTDTRATPGPRT